MRYILSEEQTNSKKEIEELLKTCKDFNNQNDSTVSEAFGKMKVLAHSLFLSLSPRPKFSKIMLANREVSPDNVEFFFHIHSVEDLLKIINE